MNESEVIIVTVIYEDYPILAKDGVKCCNCNFIFKEIPKVNDVCPKCKYKIGQIEIL